jgi:hypothetical protein
MNQTLASYQKDSLVKPANANNVPGTTVDSFYQ